MKSRIYVLISLATSPAQIKDPTISLQRAPMSAGKAKPVNKANIAVAELGIRTIGGKRNFELTVMIVLDANHYR